MIKQLGITNFKSHKNTILDVSNLTVICGANGVGKSSVFHSLLLLRESYLSNSKFEYLDLQANPIRIGTAKDALYQFSESNEIGFQLNMTNSFSFSFEAKDSDLTKTLIYKSQQSNHDYHNISKENLFNKEFQYISAARLGPQPIYKKDDVVIDVYNQISVINGQAEHFVHYLETKKNKDVIEPLISSRSSQTDLLNQTAAWEREISEGVNIIVKDLGNLGYELKYQFGTESGAGKTNEFDAINVGFGVTYVMPIIIAILAAPPGSLLLIENPEAHLHPNGQAKLTELICLAAQAGVQIIIETHSDHIINGILVQSKRFESDEIGINKENVSIYHFTRNEDDHSSSFENIEIQDGGKVVYTPDGFFDQFTIDRKFLMGF